MSNAIATNLVLLILPPLVAGAFDLPLKQCPGMQFADPSWMNGQSYGPAVGSSWTDWNASPFPCALCNYGFVPPTEIASNLAPKATIYSPYSMIMPTGTLLSQQAASLNVAGIRKWSVTSSYQVCTRNALK